MLKNTHIYNLIKQLWPFIYPNKKALIIAIIALVLNACFEASLVSMTKPLLDNGLMKKKLQFTDYNRIINNIIDYLKRNLKLYFNILFILVIW